MPKRRECVLERRIFPAIGRALCAASAVVLASVWVGCAAHRALNQPAPKDYGVLQPGTDVDLVRAELGQPFKSGRDGCDVFVFEEGSSAWRYLRAVGYSVLDVSTLGLSEIVTNPAEASVGKERIRLRVCYDANQNVVYSERLDVGRSPELVTGSYPPTRVHPAN